jgi:hypothetical protein
VESWVMRHEPVFLRALDQSLVQRLRQFAASET